MYKLGVILTFIGVLATAYSLHLMQDLLVIELSILTLAVGITTLFLHKKREQYYQEYGREQV